MSYVVYNKQTTLVLRQKKGRGFYVNGSFETMGAAKAALTRHLRLYPKSKASEFAIADETEFYKTIEKKVTRTSLMGSKPFQIGVNTPAHLDPSTETYWSM